MRGTALSTVEPDGDRDSLLDDAGDLRREDSRKFDVDLGVMANAGRIKAGFTLRNATEPSFDSAGGGPALKLQRQARAGLAILPYAGWSVAADLDLMKTDGPLGEVRNFAAGAEARIAKRHYLRGGVRLNTVGEQRHCGERRRKLRRDRLAAGGRAGDRRAPIGRTEDGVFPPDSGIDRPPQGLTKSVNPWSNSNSPA